MNETSQSKKGPYTGISKREQAADTAVKIAAILLIAVFLIFAVWANVPVQTVTKSTVTRAKAESQPAYLENCIHDELGWIEDPENVSSELRYFYEKTGCQPYLYLKRYDPALTTYSACMKWAKNYYAATFVRRQNTVLYIYFAAEEEDKAGCAVLWYGDEAAAVIDSQASQIFWDHEAQEWDETKCSGEMLVQIFNKTADDIMNRPLLDLDAREYAAVIILGAAAGVLFILLFRKQ